MFAQLLKHSTTLLINQNCSFWLLACCKILIESVIPIRALQGLKDFVDTNTRIVHKLWDLNLNARKIEDGTADVSGVLPDLLVDTATSGMPSIGRGGSSANTDAAPRRGCDLGTDASALGVDSKIGQLSESDLKRLHDEVRLCFDYCKMFFTHEMFQ